MMPVEKHYELHILHNQKIMCLENTLTTSSSNYEEKDYLDIVDFIETTVELQENSLKAQRDIEQEIQDLKLDSLDL